jgi:hypothetical protein
MNLKRMGIALGTLGAAGAVAAGAATANASTTTSVTPTTSAASSAYVSSQDAAGSTDTPVTGDELAKVTAAVTAKDSAVSVTSVQKDPDGSYDVLGTKAGAPVLYDMSADLATLTEHARGGGRGGGGPNDTPVTGDELAKVTAAVTAKDSAITVTTVRKDPDGSYDVLGTKAGASAIYDVSADLATLTEHAGRGGRGGGGSNDTPVTGDELAKVTAAVTAKDSAITVTAVRKDPDGSYDVVGTKAGASVMYDVSADLTTMTQNARGAGKSTPGATSSSGTSTSGTSSSSTSSTASAQV